MIKILIADKLDEGVIDEAKAETDVKLDVKLGLAEDQLAREIANYDGMVVRSGVKVTAKVLADVGRLRAVARAGVGVDNVDLDAATRAGVLVMNTPDANTLATAEQTFALMLAVLRNLVPACVETKAGRWERSRFVGKQLAGRQLGIIGLGRVGRAVAERALAFQMTVLAYDPLFPGKSALSGKVRLVHDLNELLETCDIITIHAGLTDTTRGMIGRDQLALMKKGAYLINCARGGIIDEDALADALKQGTLAGAAMDVYAKEPPGKLPLFDLDNVVATCHLGASTKEAQLAVARDALTALLDYLKNNTIRSAVNVAGLPTTINETQQRYVDLARRMAALVGPVITGGVKSVRVTAVGTTLEPVLPLLLRSALVELFARYLETSINLVNAELIAQSTGIETGYSSRTASANEPERLQIDIDADDESHRIIGTVTADTLLVLEIDGYRMQMVPDGNMIVILNDDKPGAIGLVGNTFGHYGVNIADLTLSRHRDCALMVFKIDEPAPKEVIEQLRTSSPPIRKVAAVELPLTNKSNSTTNK